MTMDARPSFRPLYQQVHERLVGRLIDGTWPPGMALPSEQQLALELGVSQGTVRKALDAMTTEHLLVRAQGRGTFVAEVEDQRILFRYLRLVGDDESREIPESTVHSVREQKASSVARHRLTLQPGSAVWVIERSRMLGKRVAIAETIYVPSHRFPNLDRFSPLPNHIYALYASRFGITIGRVTERLKAIAASAKDAAVLKCKQGSPLLQVDRIAYSLDETPVEWRVSRCVTDTFYYLSEL